MLISAAQVEHLLFGCFHLQQKEAGTPQLFTRHQFLHSSRDKNTEPKAHIKSNSHWKVHHKSFRKYGEVVVCSTDAFQKHTPHSWNHVYRQRLGELSVFLSKSHYTVENQIINMGKFFPLSQAQATWIKCKELFGGSGGGAVAERVSLLPSFTSL